MNRPSTSPKLKALTVPVDAHGSLWEFIRISPDPMVLQVDSKIIDANRPALDLVGAQSLADVQGLSVLSFVAPEFQQTVKERLNQILEQQQSVPVLEQKLHCLNGQVIYAEIHSIPTTYEDAPAGLIVLRDVTKQRQLEEKLTTALDEVRAASQAKTDFLTKMSHELRTPLHGVMGTLELLFKTDPTPEQEEFLGLAYNSSQALFSVISDLLDISSIESGQLKLEETPFDIEHMLGTIIATMRPKALAKGFNIVLSYPANVPHLIKGDPVRLWQLLTNLINNGIKFTDKGSLRVGVEARELTEEYLTLMFAIKDTGIGIPESEIQKIFEPFYQCKSREENVHEGTGLGLSICQQLLGVMGGSLEVESRLGVGSTFTVTLRFKRPTRKDIHSPLLKGQWWWPSAELPERFWSPPGSSTQQTPQAKTRILLVEDNFVNQRLLKSMLRQLRSFDFRIDIAENGRTAIERAQKTKYDLILMDCQMPVLNGFDATRELRALEDCASKDAPVIAVTAYAMPSDRERCLEAGMNDYISKPVQTKALHEMLGRWLSREE